MQSKEDKPDPKDAAKPGSGKSGPNELSSSQSDPQIIEITYAEDGTPEADRHLVAAESGTQVVWHGPVDDDTPFSIIFEHDPSVAEQENGLVVESSFIDDKHTAGIIVKSVEAPATYQYFMLANGRRSDPIIVVNPIIMVPQQGKKQDPDDDD